MERAKKLLGWIFTAEGLYGLLTNPWVSTVVLPSVIAIGAGLMAWAESLPWLQIYVVFFFVAACVSVLARQLLDRWEASTDRYKLVFQGVGVSTVSRNNKIVPYLQVTVNVLNIGKKPLNVRLNDLDVKVKNRIPEEKERMTSFLTVGPTCSGHFASHNIDVSGLPEREETPVRVSATLSYGAKQRLKNELIVKMDGVVSFLEDGKIEVALWDVQHGKLEESPKREKS
ncbi:hypothetical protein ACSQ76_15145 [Roseovarius sp. B08]|uniref:hypothetical protein n=1 Tax=Roseovarius sp. B08 TaxID=3449223 RepID=UPI003EDBE7EF